MRKGRNEKDGRMRKGRMEWDKARLRGQAPQAGGRKMKDEAEKRRKMRERIEKEMKKGKMLSSERSGREKRAATARKALNFPAEILYFQMSILKLSNWKLTI